MKYKNQVEEFLAHELDDYPFFEERKIHFEEKTNGWEYYSVKIRHYWFYHLFRVNDQGVQVDLHESEWEDVKWWDWHVKYFWQSILDWDYLK